MPALEISQLTITYPGAQVGAVRDVSVTVDPGERVGIVGESGSGKTTLTAAITRSLPKGTKMSGAMKFNGTDLSGLSGRDFRRLQSVEIARIPQDPLASLNPVLRVDRQLSDAIRAHRATTKAERLSIIESSLAEVGIPDASRRRRAYPHELSGGLRQRVLIALALVNSPSLLIADEPTTALDVTVQAQILDLLDRELTERKMSLLLITHDIGVVAELCNRIMVMRNGVIVEEGPTEELMTNPQDPYTRQLFEAVAAMPIRDDPKSTT
jgi:ABC-type dipeptide/oligopeptide/nickel transport system ATPase component